MKYSKIIEVNQLLLTEEVIQEYKRPQSYEKAKQQALSIAIRRWQIIPKALRWKRMAAYRAASQADCALIRSSSND